MKLFLRGFLALSIFLTAFSCTRERHAKPAPNLPPVHPAGLGTTEPQPPADPEPARAMDAREFSDRQVFSAQTGEIVPAVMKLASSVVGNLSFYPEQNAIAASYPSVVNQVFRDFPVSFMRDLLPRAWQPVLNAADLSKPVAATVLDSPRGGKAHVAGFFTDSGEFDARLRQGSFGKFGKTAHGGWILLHDNNRKVYFTLEGNLLFLADEPAILEPGAAFLRQRLESAVPQFPLVLTLHNAASNARRYMNWMSREMDLSGKNRARFEQWALPELSSFSEISLRVGLDADSSLHVEVAGTPLPQVSGPMAAQLLTPVDVADLARFLPASTAAFSLDKLAVPAISALYRDLRATLRGEMQHSSDQAKLLGYFDFMLEWMEHMYERSADSQAFFVSLHKNRLHAGALLQLRPGTNGNEILAELEKGFRAISPRVFLPTLSPEGRKELAWLPKFLEVRTKKTTLDKRAALVVTLALDWNRMPKNLQDEKTPIYRHFLGKSQELAFVLDGNSLWAAAGAHWQDILKESWKQAGRIPNPRTQTAGVLAVSAMDTRALIHYVIGEFLQIRLPAPPDSELLQSLKSARAEFEKLNSGWMTAAAGRMDQNRIGFRFTLERDIWVFGFSWYLILRAL